MCVCIYICCLHTYKTRYLYMTLSKAQHDWFGVQSDFTQCEKIAKDSIHETIIYSEIGVVRKTSEFFRCASLTLKT